MVSWNGAESSLYRVLKPIYQSNFCTIAKLIKTKSCEEVNFKHNNYDLVDFGLLKNRFLRGGDIKLRMTISKKKVQLKILTVNLD